MGARAPRINPQSRGACGGPEPQEVKPSLAEGDVESLNHKSEFPEPRRGSRGTAGAQVPSAWGHPSTGILGIPRATETPPRARVFPKEPARCGPRRPSTPRPVPAVGATAPRDHRRAAEPAGPGRDPWPRSRCVTAIRPQAGPAPPCLTISRHAPRSPATVHPGVLRATSASLYPIVLRKATASLCPGMLCATPPW